MSRARTFTKAEILDAARAASETGLHLRMHPSGEIEFTHESKRVAYETASPSLTKARLASGTMKTRLVGAHMVGVHKVNKVLADGSTATYHYAWRGGPRI